MVIVINSKGGLVSQQVEDLFQGSSKANIINVIAPFSSNIVFRANFEMPDGTILPEDKSGYIFKPSIKVVDGLNMWKLPIEFPITQNYGVVSMQLRAMMGEEILCTTTVKFPIQKGVPYDSEHVEQGTYDAILQMIADLRALLNNKVDIKNYNYKVAENIDKDTIGAYYIYDNKNDIYKVVLLPENYNENETYYKLETEGTITNRNDGIYISFQKDGEKGEIAVKETGVYINNKQVVVFDDLVAENITYDNTSGQLKAEDVKSALDELSNDFRNVKNSQVFDLGIHTIESMSWVEENSVYKYKFTHEYLTDEKTQSIIITPNDEAIDNLNNNDILIYPQIDIVNVDNTVYAIVSADKKPNFDIVAEFKLQGVSATNETPNITASYVSFNAVENVNANNVQEAIGKVQQNIDSYIDDNKENVAFVENEREKQINKLCLADNYSYTHNGVTLSQTKDRITLNGTANDNNTELVVKLLDNDIKFKENETYTLSIQNVQNGAGLGTFTIRLYYTDNSGNSYNLGMGVNSSGIGLKNITFDKDYTFEKLVITCNDGAGANNCSFNVQFEKGENWTEYVEAKGGIVNFGNNIVRFAESERQKSKNLLCFKNSSVDHAGVVVETNAEEQTFIINGNATANHDWLAYTPNIVPRIKDYSGKQITMSATVVSGSASSPILLVLNFADDPWHENWETTSINIPAGETRRTKTFIVPTNKAFDSVRLYAVAGATFNNVVIKLQIEDGTEATEWQYPYGAIVHEKDVPLPLKAQMICKLNSNQTTTQTGSNPILFDNITTIGNSGLITFNNGNFIFDNSVKYLRVYGTVQVAEITGSVAVDFNIADLHFAGMDTSPNAPNITNIVINTPLIENTGSVAPRLYIPDNTGEIQYWYTILVVEAY